MSHGLPTFQRLSHVGTKSMSRLATEHQMGWVGFARYHSAAHVPRQSKSALKRLDPPAPAGITCLIWEKWQSPPPLISERISLTHLSISRRRLHGKNIPRLTKRLMNSLLKIHFQANELYVSLFIHFCKTKHNYDLF